MTTIFFGKLGTLKMDAASSITISASTVLDTAFASATAITGQYKNIRITLPEGDVEKIDLLGTTSSFQNAELDEKPAPLCEVSGDIIIPGDEVGEVEYWGTGTAASGTHTTYQPGKATRQKLAFLFNVDDGTDEVNFAITNAVKTAGELTLNGDGYLEGNVTFKCLPKDAYIQWKD